MTSSAPALTYTNPTNIAVREEIGFDGMREQMGNPSQPARSPMNSKASAFPRPGGFLTADNNKQLGLAQAKQNESTSRAWGGAPVYPDKARVREINREVIPKNLTDFEMVGRNIGPHGTSDAVGGYVGRDQIGNDTMEKFTQRTVDDFKEYYNPAGAQRSEVGNASVYSLHEQGRIDARDLNYKDVAGRYGGAFNHDLRNPNHPIERMWQKDAYGEKPSMKDDYWMVHRNREDEGPNREGLRMQYADVYQAKEWGVNGEALEKLITPRRKQTEDLRDIDVTLIRPYSVNPYTVPIGHIPFSNQDSSSAFHAAIPAAGNPSDVFTN
jgi:hypothetical protein